MTEPQSEALSSVLRRLVDAADDLRAMRIDVRSIAEAIHTKIDVERALRRVIRDLERPQGAIRPTAV